MSWRDAPFDRDSHLCVFEPVTSEAIDRAVEGFRAWATSPRSIPFRWYRTHGVGRWRRVPRRALADHVERSIVRVPGSPGIAEFERLARSMEHRSFGGVLLVGSHSLALSFSHRFVDGAGGLIELQSMLTGRRVPESAVTRFPLLRALLATRQLSFAALRRGRRYLRDYDAAFDNAPHVPGGQVSGVVVRDFSVSAAEIASAASRDRLKAPGAAVPTSAALIAPVFRAIRACLPEGVDLPIGMVVGLRRHLPGGLGARGNFLIKAPVGTIRERPWTATDVRDRVLARVADPTAVAAYLVLALSEVRRSLTGARWRSSPPTHLQVSLSIVAGGIGLSSDDYVAGRTPRPALALLHRGSALGVHCQITATGKSYIVTTVDDSGTLDLDRLEEAFRSELAGR